MKNYYSLAVACLTLFLCSSCKKDDLNGTIVNSTTSTEIFSKANGATLNLLSKKTVNYGALIGAPSSQGSTSFQLNVADNVGISSIRSHVTVPGDGMVPILNSKYNVLLNFNSDYKGTPMPFVSDMTKYQLDLKSIVAGFAIKPVMAVIENEESNVLYHSGTPQEYIKQLMTAISVMHSFGIKVANGGITNIGLNYLVYQDFLNQGKTDSASQFQMLAKVVPKRAQTQERGAFVDALLNAYTQMDLDYVNFHWKGTSPDTQALNEVINYLKKRTGKTIITNELGQFDTDPNTLLSHVQLCTDRDFPYIVWYSPDEHAGKRDIPLQHSNQSLTPSGDAYKGYLQN